jgi:hypothetical protein
LSDFEVHEIGSYTEIKLSRALARTIEQNLIQYGNVMPQDVIKAYHELQKHYQRQIEQGAMS